MSDSVNLPSIVSGTHKVRFQDCDPFNHLNNSKYIDYMINVREDAIEESYDFNLYDLAYKQGIGWVIATNQISYLKPAFLLESVLCESQIIASSKRSITVEHRMYNLDKSHLKSVMWSQLVHIDIKKQRPIEHSDEFMGLFQQLTTPVDQDIFKHRVMALRQANP